MLSVYIVDVKHFVIKRNQHHRKDYNKNQQHKYQVGEHHFEVNFIGDQIVFQLSPIMSSFHVAMPFDF